jgi:hypothetical protein
VNKPLKLWAVDRTPGQVRQLLRELNGWPARHGKRRCAAEFRRYLRFGIES